MRLAVRNPNWILDRGEAACFALSRISFVHADLVRVPSQIASKMRVSLARC
jgi:hypothetical protein